MFDRFLSRPRCPCDPAAKCWIEERLRWLDERFEDNAFQGTPVILPTRRFFPDPFDGSDKAVGALLYRVCSYMDVDPDRIDLRFRTDVGKLWLVNNDGKYLPPGAAGTFQQDGDEFVINVDRSEIGDPMNLVGTFAHELAHARLMGEGHMSGEAYDNEILTDLTTVHFGLGLFLANSPRAWDSTFTKWPGTDLAKPEYMTAPMFAYALAHLAWFRSEKRPKWANALRWDTRPYFYEALKYLESTGDSFYRTEK